MDMCGFSFASKCFAVACLLLSIGCSRNTLPNNGVKLTATQTVQQRVAGDPVSVTLRLPRGQVRTGDAIEVVVKFEIAPRWDIHTLHAQPAISATRLDLKLPTGITAEGEWQEPAPVRSMSADGHPAYEREVEFARSV